MALWQEILINRYQILQGFENIAVFLFTLELDFINKRCAVFIIRNGVIDIPI